MDTHVTEVNWAWEDPTVQDILLKYYKSLLFCSPKQAVGIVDRLLGFVSLTPPASVLDIGCGLGTQAAEFARRGCQVTAFDPGDRYLALAIEHASAVGANIEFRNMKTSDLREISRFCLAWGGNICFGQLTIDELAHDLSRVLDALRPGGWFACIVVAEWPTQIATERTRNWDELDDCYVLIEKWRDDEFRHEHCSFVYPKDNRMIKIIERERLYGPVKIAALLKQLGFVDVETFASLSASAPAQEGNNFVFRCRKPRC